MWSMKVVGGGEGRGAGHIASRVRKQRKMNASIQLVPSFLFSLVNDGTPT